jgi:transglutaminase-like putative cysteine protease
VKLAAGCAVVLAVVVLAVSFAGLVFLRTVPPPGPPPVEPPPVEPPPVEPPPGPGPVRPSPGPPPPPRPEPDEYAPWVASLKEFAREETDLDYLITYGFIDHHGARRRITCGISKAEHTRELASYGYRPDEIEAETDAATRSFIETEMRARGLAPHLRLRVWNGGRYQIDPALSSELEIDERRRIVEDIEVFYRWLDDNYERNLQGSRAAAYRKRGFLLEGRTLFIDHGRLVVNADGPLAECTAALASAARQPSARQALGLFVAFFQEIRYEIPPDVFHGRQIQGLWVPTEVIANNHGDCDSKSIAFAAMWRRQGDAVVVVRVPGHVMVGVETRPGPGQATVRLGNRYFVLCELAGPAKLFPGREGSTRVAGHYRYTLVEPAGTETRTLERGEGRR